MILISVGTAPSAMRLSKSYRNCFVTIVAIYLLAKQARQSETFSGFFNQLVSENIYDRVFFNIRYLINFVDVFEIAHRAECESLQVFQHITKFWRSNQFL